MTSKTHTYATLTCDGCGAVFGKPGEFPNIVAARQAALALGWKAVPKRTKSGRNVRVDLDNPNALIRMGRVANDQCPQCDIEPNEYKGSRGGRPWWEERIERLQEENRRLWEGGMV